MILGGVIVDNDDISNFNATIQKYRDEQRMNSELKWSKVTNQKYKEYQRFIDYFFALNDTDHLHFRCIIIDNHLINHHKYNQGNKEQGFYKFYYQLLLHCFAKPYYRKEDRTRFIVHPDSRVSKYSLAELKVILNNGFNKYSGMAGTNPFVSVEAANSKHFDLAQINDILLGAIGFQKNGYHLLGESRKAKIDLAAYIAQKAGLDALCDDTRWGWHRFTIWNFRLKK
jgi:hypothetical protein